MNDYESLVPVVAKAVVAVSGGISSFITKTKASGKIQHGQLTMLINQIEKVLAEARAHHMSDLVTTNLEQIAKTQEYIDNLARQGRLHGTSLAMAMDQLWDLNNMLRRNLQKFLNGMLG